MKDFIKSISPNAEFVYVIAVSFGYSIYSSIIIFFSNMAGKQAAGGAITNESIIGLILYEIMILTIIYQFLKIRGSLISFQSKMNIFMVIGLGVLILSIYYLIFYALYWVTTNFIPGVVINDAVNASGVNKLNIGVIIIMSIVNPVFEETIVTGYVISALSARKGILFAVNISVLIRFLYHLYQGPGAAIAIIPMGLIFAFTYAKTKNIWPLIIAHGLSDLIAFLAYFYL